MASTLVYDFSTNLAGPHQFRAIDGTSPVPLVGNVSIDINSEADCVWMDLRTFTRSGTIRFDMEVEDLGSVNSQCTYFTWGFKTPGERASSISVVRDPGQNYPKLYSACTDETAIPLVQKDIMTGKHILSLDINNHALGNKIEMYVDGMWVCGTDGLSFDELNLTKAWLLLGTTGYSQRRINLTTNTADIIDSPENLRFTSIEVSTKLPDDAVYKNEWTLNATSGGTNYMINSDVCLEKEFTLSFWFKSAFSTTSQTVMCFGNATTFMVVEQSTTGGNQLKLRTNTNTVVCYSNPITPDTWTHVIFTGSGTEARAYLDGVATVVTYSNPQVRYKGFRIAKRSDNLDGSHASITFELDDLAIFDKALDATAVTAFHAAGRGPPWAHAEDMTHFFGMDGSGRALVGTENLLTVGTLSYNEGPKQYADFAGLGAFNLAVHEQPMWLNDPWTFAVWFKTPVYSNDPQPARTLLRSGDDRLAGGPRWLYIWQGNSLNFFNATAQYIGSVGPNHEDGNWHLAVVTMGVGYYLDMYVDNQQLYSGGTSSVDVNFTGGGQGFNLSHATYQFAGGMHSAVLWDRVITAQERADLYAGTLDILSTANVRLYMPLNGSPEDLGPYGYSPTEFTGNGTISYAPL